MNKWVAVLVWVSELVVGLVDVSRMKMRQLECRCMMLIGLSDHHLNLMSPMVVPKIRIDRAIHH